MFINARIFRICMLIDQDHMSDFTSQTLKYREDSAPSIRSKVKDDYKLVELLIGIER